MTETGVAKTLMEKLPQKENAEKKNGACQPKFLRIQGRLKFGVNVPYTKLPARKREIEFLQLKHYPILRMEWRFGNGVTLSDEYGYCRIEVSGEATLPFGTS